MLFTGLVLLTFCVTAGGAGGLGMPPGASPLFLSLSLRKLSVPPGAGPELRDLRFSKFTP